MSTLQVGPNVVDQILRDDYRTFAERGEEITKLEESEEKSKKDERQSSYRNWYQFNKEHTKNAIWLAKNHPNAYAILLFLMDLMDEYNAVMCSYRVLQEAIEVSQVTVARSVKTLKDKGFIAVMKSGTSNVYIVNSNLVWSSWSTNKKYCKFPANIILSATENQEYFEKIEQAKVKQINIKNSENE